MPMVTSTASLIRRFSIDVGPSLAVKTLQRRTNIRPVVLGRVAHGGSRTRRVVALVVEQALDCLRQADRIADGKASAASVGHHLFEAAAIAGDNRLAACLRF